MVCSAGEGVPGVFPPRGRSRRTGLRMKGWLYRFARSLFDQTIRLYYGRIEVTGRDHVPAAGPVILVANHPNSVADACLVGTQITGRRVNFIAKDTLTRAPVLGWLARSVGVVGVARPMEYGGDKELARERNRRAVETCVPRLLAGEVMAIFGEGISTDARHLHVIRRGAVRFGYAAEQAAGFRLGVGPSGDQLFRQAALPERRAHPHRSAARPAGPASRSRCGGGGGRRTRHGKTAARA